MKHAWNIGYKTNLFLKKHLLGLRKWAQLKNDCYYALVSQYLSTCMISRLVTDLSTTKIHKHKTCWHNSLYSFPLLGGEGHNITQYMPVSHILDYLVIFISIPITVQFAQTLYYNCKKHNDWINSGITKEVNYNQYD